MPRLLFDPLARVAYDTASMDRVASADPAYSVGVKPSFRIEHDPRRSPLECGM